MVVPVGSVFTNPGSVTIDRYGRRITEYPTFSDADYQTLLQHEQDLMELLSEVPEIRALPPTKTRKELIDTEWHHVGTCRMDVDGDGSVRSDYVLLDRNQRPYVDTERGTSLRVGDNSVARNPGVFNTQALAAFLGYSAGEAVVRARTPRVQQMVRR